MEGARQNNNGRGFSKCCASVDEEESVLLNKEVVREWEREKIGLALPIRTMAGRLRRKNGGVIAKKNCWEGRIDEVVVCSIEEEVVCVSILLAVSKRELSENEM